MVQRCFPSCVDLPFLLWNTPGSLCWYTGVRGEVASCLPGGQRLWGCLGLPSAAPWAPLLWISAAGVGGWVWPRLQFSHKIQIPVYLPTVSAFSILLSPICGWAFLPFMEVKSSWWDMVLRREESPVLKGTVRWLNPVRHVSMMLLGWFNLFLIPELYQSLTGYFAQCCFLLRGLTLHWQALAHFVRQQQGMFLPTGLRLCEGDEYEPNWTFESMLQLCIWYRAMWHEGSEYCSPWNALVGTSSAGTSSAAWALGKAVQCTVLHVTHLCSGRGEQEATWWFSLSSSLFVSTCGCLYLPWEASCNPACMSRHTPLLNYFPLSKNCLWACSVSSVFHRRVVGGRWSLGWKNVPCMLAVIVRGMCVHFKILGKNPVVHLDFKVNSFHSIRLI